MLPVAKEKEQLEPQVTFEASLPTLIEPPLLAETDKEAVGDEKANVAYRAV